MHLNVEQRELENVTAEAVGLEFSARSLVVSSQEMNRQGHADIELQSVQDHAFHFEQIFLGVGTVAHIDKVIAARRVHLFVLSGNEKSALRLKSVNVFVFFVIPNPHFGFASKSYLPCQRVASCF